MSVQDGVAENSARDALFFRPEMARDEFSGPRFAPTNFWPEMPFSFKSHSGQCSVVSAQWLSQTQITDTARSRHARDLFMFRFD